jgi:hypothetical protein
VATRKEYNACMRPYITGSKPKEQRKLDFCVGAKICSGKAPSREDAIQLCSLPKEPKENKKPSRKIAKGQTCEKQAVQIAECMLNKIDFKNAMNINSFQQEVANALIECQCQQ